MKKFLMTLALFLSFAIHAAESDYTFHLTVDKGSSREHGTAVAVFSENIGHFILTANHCVKGTSEAVLTNAKGTFVGKVVFRDEEMDFAVLKCNDVKNYALLSDQEIGPKKGINALVFCHYPRGKGPKTSNGILTSISQAANIDYNATAEGFYHGSSGCPVFAAGTNKVVGIALAGIGRDNGRGEVEMVEGSAIFIPAKRILQSINYYLEKRHQATADAVIVELKEQF